MNGKQAACFWIDFRKMPWMEPSCAKNAHDSKGHKADLEKMFPITGMAVLFQHNPLLFKRFYLFPQKKTKLQLSLPDRIPDLFGQIPVKRLFSALHDYIRGFQVVPPWDIFSLDDFTPLQCRVLRTLCEVPFGSTVTYERLAEMAGICRGARFAGNVLSKNPFPLIIPCHRVIRKDGKTGGFSAGPGLKKKLIEFEKKVSASCN